MESFGYQSSKADLDLWFKPEIRPEDGVKYYSYILCYIDDILCIHHNADSMLEWLHRSFMLKPRYDEPDMYLSTNLQKTRLHNGVWAIREAARNCRVHLLSNYGGKFKIPKMAENPFKMGYDPELDTSPELDPDATSYYLTIIGIIRWMIELRTIDVISKMLLLSSHVALPGEGHLEVTVHVVAHVGQKRNSRLVYDPSYPEINHSSFKECDWTEFNRDAKKAILMNAPEP